MLRNHHGIGMLQRNLLLLISMKVKYTLIPHYISKGYCRKVVCILHASEKTLAKVCN